MDIGIPNFDFFSLVQQCGFPIALAVVCGWFIMQAISLVLGSVIKSIKKIIGLIKSMDGRVRQMNVDILELDKLVSNSLDVDSLPLKVHHEVAAIMNNNGATPVTSTPKKQSTIMKKISDGVEKAQEVVDDATKIVEKVGKLKK
jgi:hypothetical protein